MFTFLKKFIKTGLVVAILVGTAGAAAFMIAGKERSHAVVQHMHGKVLATIDANIDNPAALRAQLVSMEKEYPKRISQVSGDLAELNEQIRQLDREKAISMRVVALADRDLEQFQLTMAQAAGSAAEGNLRLAAVTIDDRVYSFERANTRVHQIQNTRMAYANRAADADHDLGYLRQQAVRLDELMGKLENERAQFKTQLVSLSRQVDAIARNERLIKLVEKRNRTIQECSRYEAISLDQISGRLAEIRSRQEAELDVLASEQKQADYEDLARMQLAAEAFESKVMESEGAEVFELSPYPTNDLESAVSNR